MKKSIHVFLPLIILGLGAVAATPEPASREPLPYVRISIRDQFLARDAENVKKGLAAAEAANAGLLIEIDVAGGPLEPAIEAAKEILTTKIPVTTYVTNKALAGGAIVALSGKTLALAPGAVIGNIAPIIPGAPAQKLPEETLSPLRAFLSNLARERGLPARIILAMADPDTEVLLLSDKAGRPVFLTTEEYKLLPDNRKQEFTSAPTQVSRQGRILTLGATDALAYGVCRKVAATRRDAGVWDSALIEMSPTPAAPVSIPGTTKTSRAEKLEQAVETRTATTGILPGKSNAVVRFIPLKDEGEMIDPFLAGFLKRKIDQAKAEGVDVLIFEIDTFGGRVDSANEIVDHILAAAPMKTVAWIVKDAWSAGALVSIACDRIYMKGTASMGSATPVSMSAEGTAALGEKYISAVRAKFRAVAETKGYSADLAEAMVDPELEIIEIRLDGRREFVESRRLETLKAEARTGGKALEIVRTVVPKGKLLNVTAREAVELGFSTGTVENRDDLMKRLAITPSTTTSVESTWSERVARILSGTLISGLLMAIGILAILIEIYHPGTGIGFTVGAFCLSLFFWSKYFAGTAAPFEIVLFLVGFGLLAVEIFLIPGFGVTGIAGIILILASIILAYLPAKGVQPLLPGGGAPESVDYYWAVRYLRNAGTAFVISMTVIVIGTWLIFKYLPRIPLFGKLVLHTTIDSREGIPAGPITASDTRSLVGKTGVAETTLRPAGRITINGETYDVVAQGDFIEAGKPVRVTAVEGNRILVRGA
ncbi:MAG: NfeD family protein [Planctomycetota bacterium]